MKIGFFGDGKWAHLALDRIAQDPSLRIAYVVARFEKPDPILRHYAGRLKRPFLIHKNVNDTEFLAEIRSYNPDINVSMSFNQIFRREIIDLASLGFINCHAGALPFYRGRNILNWAIINGESRFGVTVHYVDEGIDTGDIILQNYGEILPEDDYGTVLEKAFGLCADTLYESLCLVAAGKAERKPQHSVHPVGFYCGRRGPGDEWLDWNWPSERIHNFVRGITVPGPCARSWVNDQPIAIVRSDLIPDAPSYIGIPGEVVGKNEKGIIIKTGDSALLICSVADICGDGSPAEERIPRFRIGTRFSRNLYRELEILENRLKALEKYIGNHSQDSD